MHSSSGLRGCSGCQSLLVVAWALTFCLTRVFADAPTLTAGLAHTCAIDSASRLHCWGSNTHGESNAPGGSWSQVSASRGGCHTCGVKTDGGLQCWGCNTEGQASPPQGSWHAITAGKRFTCGITADRASILCWGGLLPGVKGDWKGPWKALSAGEDWVCAIRTDGRMDCRGWSSMGQTSVPLPNATWAHVSSGFQHTCALTAEGSRLICWGSNLFGEGSPPPKTLGESWAHVAPGTHWTCGLNGPSRQLLCWGRTSDYPAEAAAAYEEFGQVSGAISPNDVCSWEILAAGKHHVCGVASKDGAVRCWGSNEMGQSRPPTSGVALPWKSSLAGAPRAADPDPDPAGECIVLSPARAPPWRGAAGLAASLALLAAALVS